jgi:phenylalanyl-tRNA synthetase beta chain
MIFSRDWIAEYFEKEIPSAGKIAELFTFHTFEIESVEGDSLDIKVLPDRAHYALCHAGIAYELSALIKEPLKKKEIKLPEFSSALPELKVVISDSNVSMRYVGARVQNIKVEESPEWLKKRLLSIGARPINNIVDITNFIRNIF